MEHFVRIPLGSIGPVGIDSPNLGLPGHRAIDRIVPRYRSGCDGCGAPAGIVCKRPDCAALATPAPAKPAEQRGSGRTLAMVRALPDTGSVVFVHNRYLVGYVQDLVLAWRGPAISQRTRIICAPAASDEDAALRGDKAPGGLPIFRDHALIEARALSSVAAAIASLPAAPPRGPWHKPQVEDAPPAFVEIQCVSVPGLAKPFSLRGKLGPSDWIELFGTQDEADAALPGFAKRIRQMIADIRKAAR